MAKQKDLSRLFMPRSVAVVGASADPDKVGHKIAGNILSGGYRGNVYLVNPHGGRIFGRKVYKSIADIDEEIDLATIAIPADFVLDAVRSCAAKRVKFLSVISSGFSEVGNLNAEKEMVYIAKAGGMRLLGPNIFGLYSAESSLNATFGPKGIGKGDVAIITQSGALGIAMIGKTAIESIGLSSIVSVGNKADLDESDLLEHFASHKNTRVILIYIEGIKDGERLAKVLRKVTAIKPVIAIKSGSSRRGALAAASHTGSLAGEDAVFSDIMKQCGVLRAESLEEALDWTKFLEVAPMPRGPSTVIITNGGGIGVMATDACEKHGIGLFDDIHALEKRFSSVTPAFGSFKNPVDITGQAGPEDYEKALHVALGSRDFHSVICLGCETAMLDAGKLSQVIGKLYLKDRPKKPIVFSFVGGTAVEESIATMRQRKIPVFADVYRAVSCLGALYRLGHARESRLQKEPSRQIDKKAALCAVSAAVSGGRHFLLAEESAALMRAAAIPLPRRAFAKSIQEAVEAAEGIGYPVVMKVVSKDIIHKSDAGGVALDLGSRDDVMDAYQAIMYRCRMHAPDARISGVEICEMVQKGTEIIIGARRDKTFGPIIMFGLGGIYVEVMKDVAFRALPIDRAEAMAMIKQVRSYPLLLGVRGEEKRDIDSIVDTMIAVGELLMQLPQIADIEINPLTVYEDGDGAIALDARILLG